MAILVFGADLPPQKLGASQSKVTDTALKSKLGAEDSEENTIIVPYKWAVPTLLLPASISFE